MDKEITLKRAALRLHLSHAKTKPNGPHPPTAYMSTEKDTVATTSSLGGNGVVDDALRFVQRSDVQNVHTTAVDDKALVRKIDGRIIPIMFLCYLMQFIDKVLLNVNIRYSLGPGESDWS
jgi:hypothetical protein